MLRLRAGCPNACPASHGLARRHCRTLAGSSAFRVAMSYVVSGRLPIRGPGLACYAADHEHTGRIDLNTIIYIVGLVVVIGAVLGFFGLR